MRKFHQYSFPQKTVQSEYNFVASEQDIHGINKDIFLDLHMYVITRVAQGDRGDLLYIWFGKNRMSLLFLFFLTTREG